MCVLISPLVDVVTDPPHTAFPEAVAYFELASGELILIDMTNPLEK